MYVCIYIYIYIHLAGCRSSAWHGAHARSLTLTLGHARAHSPFERVRERARACASVRKRARACVSVRERARTPCAGARIPPFVNNLNICCYIMYWLSHCLNYNIASPAAARPLQAGPGRRAREDAAAGAWGAILYHTILYYTTLHYTIPYYTNTILY